MQCHGEQGEGNEEKFYPVLAGQHYEYMLRQIRDIAAGRRRNANPDMVKVVKGYDDERAPGRGRLHVAAPLARALREGEGG